MSGGPLVGAPGGGAGHRAKGRLQAAAAKPRGVQGSGAAGGAASEDARTGSPGDAADHADGVHGEVRTSTLERFSLHPEVVTATQDAWRGFSASFPSREAAGERLYSSILRGLPELRRHFVMPKGVLSMRLLSGIDSLVSLCGSEDELLQFVEHVCFMTFHLQVVTPPRVVVFRDCVVDLVAEQLGGALSQRARDGLALLLDYAGGANVYVRTSYARRVEILEESWAIAKDQGRDHLQSQVRGAEGEGDEISSSPEGSLEKFEERLASQTRARAHQDQSRAKATCLARLKRFLRSEASAIKEAAEEFEDYAKQAVHVEPSAGRLAGVGEGVGGQRTLQTRTTTFDEMFEVNATVMGCGKETKVWMSDVLKSFDAIATSITNMSRLKEEVSVVALRMSKQPEAGSANLSLFRSCMLAALRSLLPKHWTTAHEEAWCWMWDNVSTMLRKDMDCLREHVQWLSSHFDGMDEKRRYGFRTDIYSKFFELAPRGQDFFKQSNTRLHFIADRILQMTVEIFSQPKAVLSEISALGLRHVGFGIPTRLFPPFVDACTTVMLSSSTDAPVNEAFRWSLSLISQILVRTIGEGSTVVMQAINQNSANSLRKAIAGEPRGRRFQALLDVHVGEQHISPLEWAIESGSLKVAEAILTDLLTIRADRSRYYYGVDELFERHPGIVKMICEEAPTLLKTLLDGLVWRSHRVAERPEGTMRRCNYFLRHILVSTGGGFSDSLLWISSTGDPALVSHPIVSKILDMLWGGVVYKSFIKSRLWNMVGLLVFLLSQEVLERHFEPSAATRYAIVAGRLYTYVVGMGRLIVYHLGRIWTWCRDTMRKIIQEIDTDGNGSIDREEMIEALSRFKDIVAAEIRKALRVLRDDDGAGAQESARKSIANSEKNTYNIISFVLMLTLALMLTHEPLIWCTKAEDWPTTVCEGSQGISYRYSIMAMIAMAVHWFILIDLAVFNTQISAFLLVLGQVVGEVKQFLIAVGFLLLMFGSAISIMCRDCPTEGGNYGDMANAIVTLFSITVSLYQGDFRQIDESPALLISVFTFLTFSVILLMNLLIAQLNRSYEYIYKDMLGFARLNRASLIVDAMRSEQNKPKWRKYVAGLKLDERVEFDEGDLGLAGCIQVLEDAKLHRQLTESINRYGGTSSSLEPWPEDKSQLRLENNEERLDRLDALIQRSLARFENRGRQVSGPSDQSGPGSREGSRDPYSQDSVRGEDSDSESSPPEAKSP